MLDYYVRCTKCMARLRAFPLGDQIAGLATRLHGLSFTRRTGQRILGLCGRFNGYAAESDIEDAKEVNSGLVERFINEKLRAEGSFQQAESYMQHLLDHLRAEGVVPEEVEVGCQCPDDLLLGKYAVPKLQFGKQTENG